MKKTLTTIIASIAVTTAANAAPFPAPPTEVYTPAERIACTDTVLQIYFANGDVSLSEQSRKVISQARADLSECTIGDISFTAITSDARTQDELLDLSTERMAIVSGAMAGAGIPVSLASMQIDTGVAETATRRPMTRRVQVHLTAWAPDIS
jgi:hypothetical protein